MVAVNPFAKYFHGSGSPFWNGKWVGQVCRFSELRTFIGLIDFVLDSVEDWRDEHAPSAIFRLTRRNHDYCIGLAAATERYGYTQADERWRRLEYAMRPRWTLDQEIRGRRAQAQLCEHMAERFEDQAGQADAWAFEDLLHGPVHEAEAARLRSLAAGWRDEAGAAAADAARLCEVRDAFEMPADQNENAERTNGGCSLSHTPLE